jgi:hypothetical protein
MHHTGRYSKYIRPIYYTRCNGYYSIESFFFKDLKLDMYVYLIYQTLAWFVIAFLVKFYEVSDLQHQLKLSQNYLSNSVFSFSYYSFFPFQKQVFSAEKQ